MSFVERVNQGESLASWLNWLTEPPAVSWSVIMGDLSAIWKGEIWTHPNAFRTGPGSCAVHSMLTHKSTKSDSFNVSLWAQSLTNVHPLSKLHCLPCHFDGLVQERRNSSALAMELRLSCTNLPISWCRIGDIYCVDNCIWIQRANAQV